MISLMIKQSIKNKNTKIIIKTYFPISLPFLLAIPRASAGVLSIFTNSSNISE